MVRYACGHRPLDGLHQFSEGGGPAGRCARVQLVKYVEVCDSTPDVVYVGYTPGYLGTYIYGPGDAAARATTPPPWVRFGLPPHPAPGASTCTS